MTTNKQTYNKKVHPCGRYRHNTVVFILAKEYNLKNLRTIHRLDRLTSGLLLFGRSPKKARQMEHQIRNRQVQKEYICRVEGEFPESSPVSNSANHPAAAPAQQQREHTSSRSSRGKRRRSSPRTALLVVAARHQAKHEDEERERTLGGDPSPHRPVKKGGSLNHHTRTAENSLTSNALPRSKRCLVAGGGTADDELLGMGSNTLDGIIECKEPIEVVSYKIGVCKVSPKGKECTTTFQKLGYNGSSSVVLCKPLTGRMHQIRVHLQYLGYPVVNDPLYNHEVFGPSKGRGGDIGGKSDEQLVKDLINIHNAENWLGIDGDSELSMFKPMKNDLEDGKGPILSDDDSESVSREASPCSESPRPVSLGSESPNENMCASMLSSNVVATLNTSSSVGTSTSSNSVGVGSNSVVVSHIVSSSSQSVSSSAAAAVVAINARLQSQKRQCGPARSYRGRSLFTLPEFFALAGERMTRFRTCRNKAEQFLALGELMIKHI
ncbi:ribosomal pseudouridine synthase [Culex quinquefasciatus]|uniref:Ribosomal pseudouridine synthase n=1 Tax=Culex quinquefasciatus TaxID=7176 RepID=B0W634_CULQU|nr:ribosomal pseudouridine synthase [Culex quinquefasciatus]|eukprot:XP_001844168.1 ribosomal pseudouridine synthase [Culex quinquefasciatus]